MGLDARDDGLEFIGRDPLAVVLAVFPALEQVVGALGNGLALAPELVGLLAEVAANHLVDLGDLLQDASPFLLQGESDHRYIAYIEYNIPGRKQHQYSQNLLFCQNHPNNLRATPADDG